MVTPEDLAANAEYIKMADTVVQVKVRGFFLGFAISSLKIPGFMGHT